MAMAFDLGDTTTYVSALLKGRNLVTSARPLAPVVLHLRVYEFSDGGQSLACRPEFTDFSMYLGHLVDPQDLNDMITDILSHTFYNDLDTRRFWEEELTNYAANVGGMAFDAGVREVELTVEVRIRNMARWLLQVEQEMVERAKYAFDEGIGRGDFGGAPASETSIKEREVVNYNGVGSEDEQNGCYGVHAECYTVHAECYTVHTATMSLHVEDSHLTLGATQRVLFISWEPHPSGFVKVNFDGSIKSNIGGAGYVIQGPDGNLLAAGGSRLFEPSVPEAELRAAWAGITRARQDLRAVRIIVEEDSTIVIGWIQDETKQLGAHPLLRDIWSLIRDRAVVVSIRHVYHEANGVADWVASFVAKDNGNWTWQHGENCLSGLQDSLYFDLMGYSRIRVIRSNKKNRTGA